MATENAPLSMDKTTAEKRTERPHWVLDDAVYSISALLLAVIIIHSIWTLIIRPRAEAVLSQRVTVTNSKDVKTQVDQLYEEMRKTDVLHPVSKEGAENIDFGTREFATIDLDGNLVTYFQWRDS